MYDTVLANRINKALKERFGINFKGEALFRVAWSEDQLEVRFGTYEDFYHGVIYLRTVTCHREVKKYSYLSDRWVLERWVAGQHLTQYHGEVPSTYGGSYEPLYVFQDTLGNALPLHEEATLALVHSLLKVVSSVERRSLDEDARTKSEAKTREGDLMMMEEASPYIAGKLQGKEAIFLGDEYDKIKRGSPKSSAGGVG